MPNTCSYRWNKLWIHIRTSGTKKKKKKKINKNIFFNAKLYGKQKGNISTVLIFVSDKNFLLGETLEKWQVV